MEIAMCLEKQPLEILNKKEGVLKTLIFLFPIIFIFCIIILKAISPGWYRLLAWQEDSPIEYATSICYFLSFVISFSIATTFFKRSLFLYSLLYFLLSICFIFVFGEEISWGQRIFSIETPEFFMTHNYQKEINLHNISGVPLHMLYIIIGFYGAFAWLIIPQKIKARHISKVNLFVPGYSLFFYFFTIFALYLYYDYLSPIAVSLFGEQLGWGKGHFIIGKDQESAEFLLGCGFLFFVIINKYRQTYRWQGPSDQEEVNTL